MRKVPIPLPRFPRPPVCRLFHLGVVLFVFFLLPAPDRVHAQEPPRARNAVYLELLGHGVLYSLNYERVLLPRVRGRIGYATFGTSTPPRDGGDGEWDRHALVVAPLTVSYLHGTTHHLEVGGGGVLLYASNVTEAPGDERAAPLAPAGLVGYRYQPAGEELLVRVAYTPSVLRGTLHNWVGIAIGYGF